MSILRVAKGHGTQNDFVLLTDPDAELDLPAGLVAAICDRRAGLGADGVIRLVRTAALVDADPGVGTALGDARPEWFMDYRNADGSLSEMCGNGIRVFVRQLIRAGLIRLADGEHLQVGTRAGVKQVWLDGDQLVADLGPWRVFGDPGDPSSAVEVQLPGEPAGLPGLPVDVGNPHVVVALPSPAELAEVDLSRPPVLRPLPPAGANVEVVVPLPPVGDVAARVGQLLMRVHERGSGETRSCGTGAVAAVLAARAWAGEGAPDAWDVHVPGGRLRVTAPAGRLSSGAQVALGGPAVIVADAELDIDALAVGEPAARQPVDQSVGPPVSQQVG